MARPATSTAAPVTLPATATAASVAAPAATSVVPAPVTRPTLQTTAPVVAVKPVLVPTPARSGGLALGKGAMGVNNGNGTSNTPGPADHVTGRSTRVRVAPRSQHGAAKAVVTAARTVAAPLTTSHAVVASRPARTSEWDFPATGGVDTQQQCADVDAATAARSVPVQTCAAAHASREAAARSTNAVPTSARVTAADGHITSPPAGRPTPAKPSTALPQARRDQRAPTAAGWNPPPSQPAARSQVVEAARIAPCTPRPGPRPGGLGVSSLLGASGVVGFDSDSDSDIDLALGFRSRGGVGGTPARCYNVRRTGTGTSAAATQPSEPAVPPRRYSVHWHAAVPLSDN